MWIASNSDVTVAINEFGIFVEKRPLGLKGLERRFVESIAKGEGRVRTPRMILSDLYADRDEPELKIFDVVHCKICRKFDDIHPGASTMLRRVWGRGFIFGPARAPAFAAVSAGLPTSTVRWVPNVKKSIVDAIRKGAVSVEQVLGSYGDLSHEELDEWIALYTRHGHSALRLTRTQNYAIA